MGQRPRERCRCASIRRTLAGRRLVHGARHTGQFYRVDVAAAVLDQRRGGRGHALTTHGATAHAPLITAAVAAGSVLCAATAFAGVLSDASWVVPAVLTVLTVSGIGVLTRHLRWPTG